MIESSSTDALTMKLLGAEVGAAPLEGQPSGRARAVGKLRPRRTRRVRLEDAVTSFLERWPYEGPKIPSADTVRTYRSHLVWFVQFTAGRGLLDVDAALTPEQLRAGFKALMDGAQSHSTSFKGGEAAANGLAWATRKLASWLLAQGVPVANLSAIRPPRPPERIQPRLLPEEFRALEQAVLHQLVDGEHVSAPKAVARDLALLYLLADTGLRCGEVAAMTIDDIDFNRGRVLVRRGKGSKARLLSVLDANAPDGGRTLHLLGQWLEVRDTLKRAGDHGRLWTSVPRGWPLSRWGIREVLRPLCLAAGLDGNRPPHAFRRATFTENYRAQPEAIKVLAARMGWSPKSHNMVNVYTRGAEVELAAEIAVPSMASLWHAGSITRAATPGLSFSGVQRPAPAQLAKGRQGTGRATSPPRGQFFTG